jgi:hypothetical protein
MNYCHLLLRLGVAGRKWARYANKPGTDKNAKPSTAAQPIGDA